MRTSKKSHLEKFIKDIRRKTKRMFTSEQKIPIVMPLGTTPPTTTNH